MYDQVLRRYPLSIQCLQTGILVGTGDALSQSIVEDTPLLDFNLRRALEFFGVGSFVIGPPKVFWLQALSRYVHGKNAISVVIKKVIIDQIFFAPFGLFLFIVSLSLVQGLSPSEVKYTMRENYLDILTANYKVWPAIQVVNFYFVPLQHQVVFIQIIAVIWNTYLSWRIHLEEKNQETEIH